MCCERNKVSNDYIQRVTVITYNGKLTFQKLRFEKLNAKLRSVKFSAKNRSLLDTRFQWSTYPEEFQISPSEGILKASNSRKRYKNYLDDFFINIYLNIKNFLSF